MIGDGPAGGRVCRTLFVAFLIAVVALPALPSRAEAQSEAPLDLLKVGDVVTPFDAEGIDGDVKHVVFAKGSTTVLLFFLSGCPVCHRMIPEWNRAFERRTKGLQIVGVLMDKEPPGFFMATPISFPVVRAPGGTFARGSRSSGSPCPSAWPPEDGWTTSPSARSTPFA